MIDFDQAVSWRQVEERLARTENPRHRKMLQTVIDHARAEAVGDVDGLMATLGPDPQYHFWSGGKDWGPKGAAGVRRFYEEFVASKAGFFESFKERIVVDDDTVITEGTIRGIVPGTVARARGYDVDVDGHYMVVSRVIIAWPFDEECRLMGEDSYGSSDTSICERIAEEDLPPAYRAMVAV
jgi:hypothetical protein